ncbi:MAG: phosphoribosylanthranilate isomerase [Pyrinomonadaceae bacterium]|nr:phosphoribosylanthranilate isomerase [Pyrinomonadaceae bacterium]MCX7640709.1 phosphoribosylanthranilate isomerase [Pyrinomonadaceae bacterium]MDW8305323.1 phosphoribosylanthranilate isomerase [Acidobacteriota bacterium]
MKPKVKICGITNREDAVACVRFGADALGFNFYSKSPRYIEPTDAKRIADSLPSEVLKVGVFVNESIEKVLQVVDCVGLDAIQLHSEETPDFIKALKAKTNRVLIKAFRIGEEFSLKMLDEFDCDYFLLDSYSHDAFGGTGNTFDWEVARRISSSYSKVYLAGGLSVMNVTEAIRKVEPYGVDVCSGVEKQKGIKDLELVRCFIELVKGGGSDEFRAQ